MGLASCHQNRFTWHANLSSARSDNGVGWAICYTSTSGVLYWKPHLVCTVLATMRSASNPVHNHGMINI
jgi:hypothetical protein